MGSYVIKKWHVSEERDTNGYYIAIHGRSPGLMSWVLSLAGIEATVSFCVDNKNVIYSSGSWSGRSRKSIPLEKISSVYYGFSKPWKEALTLAVVGSALTYGIGAILFVPIAIVYYILNKKLTIGIGETSGVLSGIDMKRSVIEGKKLDEADAESAYSLLQRIADHANRHSH